MRSMDADAIWPPGMLIRVSSASTAAMELLWLREAWALDAHDGGPPPLDRGPRPLGADRRGDLDTSGWAAAWTALWREVAAFAPPHDVPDRIRDAQPLGPGTSRARRLEREWFGPRPREVFGDRAFGDDFARWLATGPQQRTRYRSLDETPERRSVGALVRAWRAGLVEIVTVPCRGSLVDRPRRGRLVITRAMRHDPARYTAALDAFAAG